MIGFQKPSCSLTFKIPFSLLDFLLEAMAQIQINFYLRLQYTSYIMFLTRGPFVDLSA